MTVLIVDDDAAVRHILARFLEREGLTVVQAGNGQTALDYLTGGGTANVILLDLRMPIMDGWTFRQEQRRSSAFGDIPVIVLSGADVGRFVELDAAATFQKPVRLADLCLGVRLICENARVPVP